MKTKTLTLSALMAALSVGFILMAAFIPVMEISFTAIAGVCPAAAMLRGGRRAGVMTWLAASVLCLLFAAAQPAAILYACLFGLYPVVKSLCEVGVNRILSWLFKFLFANLGGFAVLFLYSLFFPALMEQENYSPQGIAFWEWGGFFPQNVPLWLIYLAAFLMYDLALTRILAMVQKRLKPNGGQ